MLINGNSFTRTVIEYMNVNTELLNDDYSFMPHWLSLLDCIWVSQAFSLHDIVVWYNRGW